MRQKNETAASFNELQKITQMMRAVKNGAPTNATNQESERTQASHNANAKAHTPEPTQACTQTSDNANISEIASQSAPKPKTVRTKNHALKPTKRAFSDRKITTIRDNSQANANKSLETKESNHANAFKSDEANTRGQE
ncbi:hypothetical protein HpBGD52_13450 [Helicobacter pylori]|uniref:hypothetical protein n=1 Tax=Helicobacter pylori TaxID=210 RepID=UPI003091DE08|nr:hypothetical protein KVE71_01095 [Helicobacter pylori]